MRLSLLFIVSLLCSLVSAAPPGNLKARDIPVPPSDDPFYSPPSGFEDQPLGSILRIRKKENAYGIVVFQEKVQAIYQVLVRSEDTHHQPIAVMSTIFVPFNGDPKKLLSYQIAEDSSYINCSPSYAMQLWSNPETYITAQVEQLLVLAALEQGYYVNVPDHEGPKSTFVAGYSAGYAVLNTVKAALSTSNTTGIDPDADVAFWGYSGGSFATAWGAQLQPSYYPDLPLIGSAMGGIPANISHVAEYNMGKLFAGFIFAAINGLSHEYPELHDLVKEKCKPEKYATFIKSDELCLIEELPYYWFDNWTDYFEEGANVLYEPIVQNITEGNNMLTNGLFPECPFFIYSSENDEIIPIGDTDKLYDMYCAHGLSVEYRKDTFSEHIITAISGAGLAFNFIKDRFNGVPVSKTCQTSTTVSDVFDTGSLSGLGEVASADIAALLGKNIGPTSVKIK